MARIPKRIASLCHLNLPRNSLLSLICLDLRLQPEMQATSSFIWRSGSVVTRRFSSVLVTRSFRWSSSTPVRSFFLLQAGWLLLSTPSGSESHTHWAQILRTQILLFSKGSVMRKICWFRWSTQLSRIAQNLPRARAPRLHPLDFKDSVHTDVQEAWWKQSRVRSLEWVLG